MNLLIITDVVRLFETDFLVALVFGEDGQLVDNCVTKYDDVMQAAIKIGDIAEAHGKTNYSVWTSNKEFFTFFLALPGVAVELKHPDDVEDCRKFAERNADILKEFYHIEEPPKLPELPRWRKRLFLWLEKLTNKIGGNGNYEI